MKKNGFAPVLIVLIIAILGVVGYFGYKSYFKPTVFSTLTPISTSTSTPNVYLNWKDYSLGEITFKLPNGWTENKTNENDVLYQNNTQTISIHREATTLNLEDYFNKGKEDTKYLRGGSLGPWTEVKTILDGKPAIKVETMSTENQSKKLTVYTVKTPNGNTAIVITIDNEFEFQNEFISSIKFAK